MRSDESSVGRDMFRSVGAESRRPRVFRSAVRSGLLAVVFATGLAAAGLALSASAAMAAVSYTQTPGVLGSGAGFSRFLPTSVAVDPSVSGSDPSAGDVYVVNQDGSEALEKFTATGQFLSSNTGAGTPQRSFVPGSVVVDPSNGDVYVADRAADVVDKFDDAGNYLCQISASTTAESCVSSGAAPTGTFSPFGLAVNPANGDLYVVDGAAEVIDVFSAAGKYESQFGGPGTGDGQLSGGIYGVAVDSDGNVYVASGAGAEAGRVQEFNASGDFVKVLDSGDSLSVAVDASTDDVYVGDLDPSTGASSINMYTPSGALITSFGSYVGEHGGSVSALAENSSNGTVYVTSEYPEAGYIFTEASGSVGPTVTSSGSASPVTATTATLTGTLNPNGTQTTYHFEYGPTEAYGTKIPVPDASAPAGTSAESVSATLSGLEPNTTYYFRLAAADGYGYLYGEKAEFTTETAAPIATTGQASEVQPGNATLNATVNPEHAQTTYDFQYVDAAQYDATAPDPYSAGASAPLPAASAGAAFAAEPVSATITGLTQDTTYDYRVVATNSAHQTNYGADQTLTTPSLTLTTELAGPVSQTSAGVQGTLNPAGLETTYEFQYGTSSAYGSSTTPQSAGSGTTVEREGATLTGLAPGTTYHYRLVATDSAGTAYGADQTFTTYAAVIPANPLAATVGAGELAVPATPTLIPTPTLALAKEAGASLTTKPKSLTKAQKLAKALKACKKQSKGKRTACEKQARKRYSAKRKAKKQKTIKTDRRTK